MRRGNFYFVSTFAFAGDMHIVADNLNAFIPVLNVYEFALNSFKTRKEIIRADCFSFNLFSNKF